METPDWRCASRSRRGSRAVRWSADPRYAVYAALQSRWYRQLAPNHGNLDDPLPLTPNMLLTGKSIQQQDPLLEDSTRALLYGRRRLRTMQYAADQLWKRFRNEYLHELQRRNKWEKPNTNIDPGGIVILQDESSRRCNWLLAVVLDAPPVEMDWSARVV